VSAAKALMGERSVSRHAAVMSQLTLTRDV